MASTTTTRNGDAREIIAAAPTVRTSQALIISGMHRSGTSLVSSLIRAGGVHLGEQLLAGNSANPRGYFEDVDFYDFHEQLLHDRRQTYLFVDDDFTFDPTTAEAERAQQLVAERCDRGLWGWKDPRTSLFLDFWLQQLPEARFVFVYRRPLDVLASLVRRGEFDSHPLLAAGVDAWRLYNARIKAFCDRYPQQCVLVAVEGVVERPEELARLVTEKLGVDLQLDLDEFARIYRADELATTPLSSDAAAAFTALWPEVAELYRQLDSLADLPAPHSDVESSHESSALVQFASSLPQPVSGPVQHGLLHVVMSQLAFEPTAAMLRRFEQSAHSDQRQIDHVWRHVQQLECQAAEQSAAQEKDEQLLQQQRTVVDQQCETIAQQQGAIVQKQATIDAQGQAAEEYRQAIADLGRTVDEQRQVIDQQATRIRAFWSVRIHAAANRCRHALTGLQRIHERRETSPMSSITSSNGSPATANGSIAGRIDQLRKMGAELRTRPVTGSFAKLRKLVYQTIRPAFSRQHTLNAATVDLIDSLYRELERGRSPQVATAPAKSAPAANVSDVAAIAAAAAEAATIASGDVLASSGQVQDQARLNNIRPLTGFNAVYTAPAELRMPERVALYGLVFGLQPKNCLEIGTFRGGSTAIICGAMDDTGFGRLACIDPTPKVESELWSRLSHRCTMFEGLSPDILPQVARAAAAPFDFAWIDGNHTYECLRADIAGVLPLLADQAYVLFHDAHYSGVKRAIDEAVAGSPQLLDCGLMSVEPTVLQDNGQTVSWAGMRLLRFQRSTKR
jgi:predicted O-methyltransferase YrrM